MSKAEALCVIPARLESTRLPRKLLRTIAGRSILQFVYENAKKSKLAAKVVIACDHQMIKEAVEGFGGEAVLTDINHTSGTERIAEVAAQLTFPIVVNLQGDEPLMDGRVVDQVIELIQQDPECVMASACIRKNDPHEFTNPNVVKTVKDQNGWALYFSRAPIPHNRDGGAVDYLKHLGIYAYRKEFLLRFPKLPASSLEQREKLEQLRAMDHGYRIKLVETTCDSIGVDTEADFELVKNQLLSNPLGKVFHA